MSHSLKTAPGDVGTAAFVEHTKRQVRAIYPAAEKRELENELREVLDRAHKKAQALKTAGGKKACFEREVSRAVRSALEAYSPAQYSLH